MNKVQTYSRGAAVFLFIFFGSLTNSIFVNQIGYYGALFFLLLTWYETKEMPFAKNGLEIALLLYLAAELVSLVFSLDKANAFQNFLKRLFLMPIMYVIPVLLTKQNLKRQLSVIAGFALVGMVLYLIASYRFVLLGEYQRTESGPSLFQYPITAAEIMTFMMLFFFALALEKGKLGYKRLLLFACFAIALLAVMATYKKTGWLGGATGIMLIIFMQRKWAVNIAFIAAGILLLIFAKNSSTVSSFTLQNSGLRPEHSVSTNGLALNVQQGHSLISVSDYTNGVLLFDKNLTQIQRIETIVPVNETQIVNDTSLAVELIDTRVQLYTKSGSTYGTNGKEFLSPGFTVSWMVANNMLYVLDRDSGLTIFPRLFLPDVSKRYEYLNDFEQLSADSLYLWLYSAKRGLEIFPANDMALEKPVVTRMFDTRSPKFIKSRGKRFFFFYADSIAVYDVAGSEFRAQKNLNLPQPPVMLASDGKQLVYATGGNHWFSLDISTLNISEIQSQAMGPKYPLSMSVQDASFVTTLVHRSPIARIFDVNHPSNHSRFALWIAGWKIFKDHPLFGVGDIDLAKQYIKYKRPYDKEIQGHLHNNFMHILATLGFFGICAFLFLIYKLYSLYIGTLRTVKENAFYSALAVGGIASLTAFLVAGLTEWDFGDHEIITIVWLITGLMVAIKTFAREKEKQTI
jgi:O-antigen ligase